MEIKIGKSANKVNYLKILTRYPFSSAMQLTFISSPSGDKYEQLPVTTFRNEAKENEIIKRQFNANQEAFRMSCKINRNENEFLILFENSNKKKYFAKITIKIPKKKKTFSNIEIEIS